ncbi:MAG: RHS repeat-associated core domain-containing protein, partial [Lysobacteraceae bacterium]
TEFERDALHRETVRTQGRLRSYFERDAVGRLVRQFVRPGGDGAPAPEPKIARHYHYDRAGQLLGIDDARSGRSLYRYDATGRLLAASGPLGEERFAFDPASNLLDPGQPPTAAPGEKRSWTTGEWADYVRAHIDDPGFNPLQGPGEAHEDPASWGEARPNRLLVYRDHRYRYDEWGNTVEKRSGGHRRMQLHWDADHQLRVVRIERGEGINRAANDAGPTARPESTVEIEHWAYDYDPFGRRIAKYPVSEARAQVWIEDGDEGALGAGLSEAIRTPPKDDPEQPSATTFAWDGNRLLAEHRADVHQLYLYEPDSFAPLAIVRRIQAANADAETTAEREDLPPAELITLRDQYPEQWARVQARRQKLARQMGLPAEPESAAPEAKTEVFHVHVDHLGTPREITDADGHLVWTATYKAWGEAVVHNPPRRMLRQVGNAITEVLEEQDRPLACNLRFQGQYADAESGLHYNRFRYYDPGSARFSSPDPIGLEGGHNPFVMAPNSTGWADPLGLTGTIIIGEGQAAIEVYAAHLRTSDPTQKIETISGAWDDLVRRADPPGEFGSRDWTCAMAKANGEWIREMHARGFKFITIGTDDQSNRSPFYREEMRTLRSLGVKPVDRSSNDAVRAARAACKCASGSKPKPRKSIECD